MSYISVHLTCCRVTLDNADPETLVGLKCKAIFCFPLGYLL